MGLRASTISNFHDLIELLQRDSRSSPAQPRRLASSRAQVKNRRKSEGPPMLGSFQAACSAWSFLECRPSPSVKLASWAHSRTEEPHAPVCPHGEPVQSCGAQPL